MRDTMQVIVTGRQGGKTSAIVDWLLEGHSIAPYPGWSRVILCASHREVVRVTGLVREATEGFEPGTWAELTIADIRKCVWSVDDLTGVIRSGHGAMPGIQVGVDDVDLVIANMLGWQPSLITMTGELHDINPEGPTNSDQQPLPTPATDSQT